MLWLGLEVFYKEILFQLVQGPESVALMHASEPAPSKAQAGTTSLE